MSLRRDSIVGRQILFHTGKLIKAPKDSYLRWQVIHGNQPSEDRHAPQREGEEGAEE